MTSTPVNGLHRRSGSGSVVLTLVSVLFFAVVCGLAIVVLPQRLSIGLSGVVVLTVMGIAAGFAPAIRTVPSRTLAWGLTIALVFYFIWPRNVFLPIAALPVKHPQRLVYLLFLAYAFFIMFKCKPAREQMMAGLRAVPWLSGLWAAMAVWEVLSLLTAEYSLLLVGGWFVDLLVVTALYPLMLMCCPTLTDLRRLMWGLLVAAALNVLFAVPETLLQRNLFERFVTLEYLDPETARQIIEAKIRGGQFRAQAAFDHPLLFAEYLAVCLPMAGALALRGGRGRWLAGGLVFWLLGGLYLSHSRVAIVATVLVGVAMFAALVLRGAQAGRRNPWPLIAALFALPLVLFSAVLATDVVQNVTVGRTASEASSTSARLQMLSAGSRLVMEQPILGYGPGMAGRTLNFQNTFGVMTLDNYMLKVALDSGLPALLLFVMLLLAMAWRALSIAVRALEPRIAYMALAAFGAVAAFAPIKLVLGTGLNNILLPVLLAMVGVLAASTLKSNYTYSSRV